MNNNYEFWLKILSMIIGALLAYHKYIIGKIEKKVDKEECRKQNEHFLELRRETNKTLFRAIEDLKKDVSEIKTHLMNNK